MSDEPDPSPSGTFDEILGFVGYEFDGDSVATARMPVIDAVRQPFGIVHGGAYAGLAESLCSRATYEAVAPEMAALGQATETLFLRPCPSGTVKARAEALHRGRTSWVWNVEMTDEEGRLCATSRLIIAVRKLDRPRQG